MARRGVGRLMRVWLAVLAADMVALSVIALGHYAWDKRQAGRSGRRIPEKQLHMLSLLGGWPGALIGQRLFRHKTVKTRFRVVFWMTVAGHIALAGGVTYLAWSTQR